MNLILMVISLINVCLMTEVISLRLTRLVVPALEMVGSIANLECAYELNTTIDSNRNEYNKSPSRLYHISYDNSNEFNDEGETLYSVKWYKDNEEFYRYVPKANPKQQSYKVEGIRVDHEHSNDKHVKLKRLTIKSSGVYRCEVSAEAPNFSSVQGEGRLEVVLLPREKPQIIGDSGDPYQVGDILILNCTSGKAHPAPLLEWSINDEPITKEAYIFYPDIVTPHGLITTVVGLQMIVESRHFQAGVIRVKCLCSMSPLLYKVGRDSVVLKKGQPIGREAMLLVRNSSCTIHHNCTSRTITTAILIIIIIISVIENFSKNTHIFVGT